MAKTMIMRRAQIVVVALIVAVSSVCTVRMHDAWATAGEGQQASGEEGKQEHRGLRRWQFSGRRLGCLFTATCVFFGLWADETRFNEAVEDRHHALYSSKSDLRDAEASRINSLMPAGVEGGPIYGKLRAQFLLDVANGKEPKIVKRIADANSVSPEDVKTIALAEFSRSVGSYFAFNFAVSDGKVVPTFAPGVNFRATLDRLRDELKTLEKRSRRRMVFLPYVSEIDTETKDLKKGAARSEDAFYRARTWHREDEQLIKKRGPNPRIPVKRRVPLLKRQ